MITMSRFQKKGMRVGIGKAYRFVIGCLLACCIVALPMQADEHFPAFSWDRVPVYAHVAKAKGDFTNKELDFLAKQFDFICIEKGQAAVKYGNTEDGFVVALKQIKQRNPDVQVLYYWNASLDSSDVRWGYKAAKTLPANPHLKDKDGNTLKRRRTVPYYDHLRQDMRDWWTDAAQTAVTDDGADGIFADAMSDPPKHDRNRLDKQAILKLRAARLALMQETRAKIGPDKLILFNGLMHESREKLLDSTDGAMIERFGYFDTGSSKENMKAMIETIQTTGKAGKIVLVKAWPGFSYRDKEMMKTPKNELVRLSKERVTFSLAAFLVAAQPHSYLCYTWGYREMHGTFVAYPEFDKPLGPPKGDAVNDGWTYTRAFEHASVFVNLETREARIDWKPGTTKAD